MTTYFVHDSDLSELLDQNRGSHRFAAIGIVSSAGKAASKGAQVTSTWLDRIEPDSPIDIEAFKLPRTAQSPKGLFLPASESVGKYGPAASDADEKPKYETLLIGVRGCELRARQYMDKVLLEGEFDDPSYQQRRQAMTVVSCDCADCTESCCCTLMNGQPFCTEGFDINLSNVDGGWIVEVASDNGRSLIGARQLPEATAEQLEQRESNRKEMIKRVCEQNSRFTFAASDPTSEPADALCAAGNKTQRLTLPEGGDDAWQQFAADCVECGACTHICPTCYCFYLYDQALSADEFERVRTWDSCLLSTYHRMAGGPNMKLTPRPSLFSRLANRVLHKFTYSGQQYSLLGCVGCGRCIDACLGAIDIREVVQTLATAKEASAK